MRSLIASVIALVCVSCAAPGSLVLPEIPNAPEGWPAFSAAVIPGSECPPIDGVYLEPPLIHRRGVEKQYLPKSDHRLFVGPIPFHRADEKQLAPAALEVPSHGFVIRQPEALTFDFFIYNYEATAISESRFRSDEGDFECHRGHIEFPRLIAYGMIEGTSDNFQIRNVVLLDETGALVIQSTRGPYRGSPAKMAGEVSYEFFRYARSEE